MVRVRPVDVKLTRTPLAGGSDTVIEQTYHAIKPARPVRGLTVRKTQSVGQDSCSVVLANRSGVYDAWASGDVIKVEARRREDAVYKAVFEGHIGEPTHAAGATPFLEFDVIGLDVIALDFTNLAAAKPYASGTAYTTLLDDLISTQLSGYARTITSDALATNAFVEFPRGTKLREAVDYCRRALIAGTSDKWEYTVTKAGATRTFKFFKRSTTSLATYKRRDLLGGTRRSKGSVTDVVNKATILGATLPTETLDKLSAAQDALYRLDAAGKRLAIPFKALDTPLYLVTVKGDRSRATDPPALQGFVARNSDNKDKALDNRLAAGTVIRNRTVTGGAIANVTDGDTATNANWDLLNDGTTYELIVWDLGAGGGKQVRGIALNASATDTPTWIIQSSPDDATWTTRLTATSPPTNVVLGSDMDARYWRLLHQSPNTAGTTNRLCSELLAATHANLSADATNPENVNDFDNATTASVATTGNQSKELARYNLRSLLQITKAEVRHTDPNDVNFNVAVEISSDDNDAPATWKRLVLLSNSGGLAVTDTIYVEEADARHIRFLLVDARGGGSGSQTTTCGRASFWLLKTDAFGQPLTGDEMEGSSVSWAAGDMAYPPSSLVKKTYPAPLVAIRGAADGIGHWFILKATSATATSYWEVGYDDGGAAAGEGAKTSTDSGSTWAALGTNSQVQVKLEFNNKQVQGTAENAASQTKYANLVPSGILAASIVDEALMSQEMVDREAVALVKARNDVVDRLVLVVPYDPALEVGSRVTLDADVKPLLGTSGAFDVVEAHGDPIGSGVSTLVLGEHFPSEDEAAKAVASVATQRRA